MKSFVFDNNAIKVLTISSLCLLSIEPWFIWGYTGILRFLAFIYFSTFIFQNRKLKIASFYILILFIYIILLRSGEFYYIYSNLSISILFALFISSENKLILIKVYNISRKIFAYSLSVGIIFYLLHFYIDLPSFVIKSRNLLFTETYECYIFFVKASTDIDIIPRFRFIFDEAGVLGTLCFYFLLSDRFRFKNKLNYIILLGGIMSFSLFFYIGSIILFILANSKNVKKTVFVLIIIVSTLKLLSNNEYVNDLIISRIELADKGISGNNRTSDSWDHLYRNFRNSDSYLFGKGTYDFLKISQADIASYQTFIYQYGVFGLLLLLSIYTLLIKSSLNYFDTLLILLGMLFIFYQRPWIFQYYNTIMIFTGIANYNFISKHSMSKHTITSRP